MTQQHPNGVKPCETCRGGGAFTKGVAPGELIPAACDECGTVGVRPVEPPTLLTREEVHAALPAPTTSGEFHGGLNVQMTWHHFNEWAENIQRAVLAKHGVGVGLMHGETFPRNTPIDGGRGSE